MLLTVEVVYCSKVSKARFSFQTAMENVVLLAWKAVDEWPEQYEASYQINEGMYEPTCVWWSLKFLVQSCILLLFWKGWNHVSAEMTTCKPTAYPQVVYMSE
jgi:hypothetical protein